MDMTAGEFVAIDVETANEDLSSICQTGLAIFRNGEVVDRYSTLVNPSTHFTNTWLHGIDENDVRGAPVFSEVLPTVQEYLRGTVTVHHTHFDRTSFHQASERNGLPKLETTWLDTARVARRTWPQFQGKGWGLENVCKHIGHQFKHHDALEDAIACGHVMVAAIREGGLSVGEWVDRIKTPPKKARYIARDGNPDGVLHGEVAVFTGALSIPRREIADLAARAGCDVGIGVTRKTTLLVVGDQDIGRLAGHDLSSKHRKAHDLLKQGQNIRILQESDFVQMLDMEPGQA